MKESDEERTEADERRGRREGIGTRGYSMGGKRREAEGR